MRDCVVMGYDKIQITNLTIDQSFESTGVVCIKEANIRIWLFEKINNNV